MTTPFSPENIPRGSGRLPEVGERAASISLTIAQEPNGDGIYPGSITTAWGVVSAKWPDSISPLFMSDVVYDPTVGDALVSFGSRGAPYHAPFSMTEPGGGEIHVQPLGDAGRLVAYRYTSPVANPTGSMGLYAVESGRFGSYSIHWLRVWAGERGASGFDRIDAAIVLSGLAEAIVPTRPAAAKWAVRKLLPSAQA